MGHRTILAPAFLVERGLHGLLADTIGGSGGGAGRPRVDELERDEVGLLTVIWTTDRLSRGDLEDPPGSGGPPVLDEHGRPLEMVYGVVIRGRADGQPVAADLRTARALCVPSYQRFLADERGFGVDSSKPFELLGMRGEPETAPSRPALRDASLASAAAPDDASAAPEVRRTRTSTLLIAGMILTALCLIGGGVLVLCSGPDVASRPVEPRVVASTSWVGSFARAAGADDVELIVPAGLRDPSHYDPTQSELATVREADYVLYSPADAFAARLRRAATGVVPVAVTAQHSRAVIRAEVQRLARILRTKPAATRWLTRFDATYRHLSRRLRLAQGSQRARVVSHRDMLPWAAFAGARLVGTYGPAALTPPEVQRVRRASPDLVFDDAGSPIGRALQPGGAPVVELVNVPGAGLDLIDLFRRNADAILAALRARCSPDRAGQRVPGSQCP